MRYAESDNQIDLKKEKDRVGEQIDLFLDEFMSEEYKGREHIVARDHYGKVFNRLLPKYLRRTATIFCKAMEDSEKEEVLR